MSPHIFILFFISDIIFMLAIERFMGVFFEKRRTSFPVMSMAYLLYLVTVTVVRLLSESIPDDMGLVIHMMCILPVLFIISLNYESSVPKRFMAIVLNYIMFSLVISFANVFIDVNDYAVGTYAAGSLLSYFVAHLLRRFRNIRKRDIPRFFLWLSALIVPGAILSMMISDFLELPLLTDLSVLVLILGVNFLAFYMYGTLSAAYENKLKSALHSQEREYYLSQCRLMQESLEKMKSYRHDMKIHLAALKDYTVDNQSAADYLNTLLGDIKESEVYCNTGNIAFDSIINFKLNNAGEENIKPEITVSVPAALNIEVTDIVTIIGNLLDNALDAVAKVEEKIIRLNIRFSQGNLFINMDNTFDGKVKYVKDNAGEETCITTLKEGDQHGYGLKNIRQSVEKYNGNVEVTHTAKIFSVGLHLCVDDNERRMA